MTVFNLARPVRLSLSGGMSINAPAGLTFGTGTAVATAFTISGPTSGLTGIASTFTVTPNGQMAISITVSLSAPDAALSTATLVFASGSTAAQTFTVTRSTDGTSSVSMTNNGGLTVLGSPISYTTSASTLVHDGPATPEQISLWLPYTGAQSTTATCRYRVQGAGSWTTGHPLYRIQPNYSDAPNIGGTIQDGFAWPIIDLSPGTTYEVEVTLSTGPVYTLTHTTRSLPATAGAATRTANSIETIQSQLSAMTAGDVLEIAEGDYTITAGTSLTISNKTGTEVAPIYVRGASRTGTIIRKADAGTMFSVQGARRVIFENMTLVGAATTSSYIRAFSLHDGSLNNYITVRNITASGLSSFFYAQSTNQTDGEIGAVGCLVYNNTVTGIGLWSTSPTDYLGSSTMWSNDGININGAGSAAFNNTISGFGDTFACATHVGGDSYTSARGVHIYRNDIRNSCDDVFEADYGRRNITFYDNRCHNVINAMSIDPLHGGPYLHARNIYVNLYRMRPFKWNTLGSGFFIYNNTIIEGTSPETVGGTKTASYISGGSGSIYHRYYGYRNNVFVWQGGTTTDVMFYHENVTHDPIDWTHNSHWPDAQIRFGSLTYQTNLAGAQTNWPNSTPVFSGATKRFMSDTILASAQPFTQTITVGASTTEITATYTPAIASGTAKNSGVAIPNITDGYSWAAPDRGALIDGRSVPAYGDRSTVPPWVPATNRIANLAGSLNSGVGRSVKFWTANGGIGFASWWGTHGSVITAGGGHGDGSDNDVWRLDIDTATWTRIKPAATVYVKSAYVADATSGLMWANATPGDTTTQAGEVFAPHAGGQIVCVPETGVPGQGATNGWLFWAGLYAMPEAGQQACNLTYKMRMGVDVTYTRHSPATVGLIQSYWVPITNSCYDSSRRRLWGHPNFSASGGSPSAVLMYRDLDSQTVGNVTFSGGSAYAGSINDMPFYSAGNDCVISIFRVDGNQSQVGIAVWDLSTSTMYRPTISGTGPTIDERFACGWSDVWGRAFLVEAANPSRVWFLTPTGSVESNSSWAWSYVDLSGGPLQFASASGGIATGLNRIQHVTSAGDVLIWCGVESQPVQVINVTPS